MAEAPVLYQETRLSPNPLFPSSVLHINTTGSSNGIFATGRKRAFDEISGHDQDSFARKNLASEGSVFFRSNGKAPRSFLWRVLNNRQLLEVQCVDLVVDKKQARSEGWLTFHIALPAAIIPNGVALADAEERDALDIFVLTGDELYTITLKRDLLTRETPPADFDSSTCFKKFAPSTFSFRHPYRLYAASSFELFISLHDGGLMRLERHPNETGAQWRQTFFSEGGWSGTLKGLIPFGRPQTVRYGNHELDANAIASIVKSPDEKYVWTVSLDHTLKAWSIKTGKIVLEADLLHEKVDRDEKKRYSQYIMSAEQGILLQIVTPPSGSNDRSIARVDDVEKYFIVVHSPKDHQFKFYKVSMIHSSVVEEEISLTDAQPATKLIPPINELMNTNIWHLEQFFVSPGAMWQQSQLWLRTRSGALCQTYTITFDLLDEAGSPGDLDDLWKTGWSVVDATSLSTERLKEIPEFSGLDIAADATFTSNEKWLNFLFFPNRFSEASLETALFTYRKAIGLSIKSGNRQSLSEHPLKERLTSSIATKVVMGRLPNDQPDYDNYHLSLNKEWQTFYSILSDLHKQRHESLSMSFDAETDIPWIVCADFVAPVRLCSNFELLCLNSGLVMANSFEGIDITLANRIVRNDDEEDVLRSQVIAVARQFRHSFSEASKTRLNEAAVLCALNPPEDQSSAEAIQSIYDACDLHNEVSDEEFNAVNEAAEQFDGLGSLSVDNFLMIVEMLQDNIEGRGKDSGMEIRRYGAKMTVAIAQQTLQQTYSVLLDILALVVFMTGDLEPSELHPEFRSEETFDAIIMRLRHLLLRLWLVGNVRQVKQHSYPVQQSQEVDTLTPTLYEDMFIGDWDPRVIKKYQEFPELLTFWSKRWIFGLDLSRQWEDVTGQMMANLLKHKNFDLAQDFVKFLVDGPWSHYLKARLFIATGNYAVASLEFKQAADDMARLANPSSFHSSNLLSAEDLTYFGGGASRYFQHVSDLFEEIKVYSYTSDFASLALAQLDSSFDFTRSLMEVDEKKNNETDSPATDKINNRMEEIQLLRLQETRNAILTRLFNALNQTGHFEQAYDAILNIANPQLQLANLQTLIQTCIRQDATQVFLQLPVTGILAHEADQTLLQLAKKSLASGPASGPAYHKILFAFRARRSDFRGAAAILYEHLERLRYSRRRALLDPEDDTLVHIYVLLINTLACCSSGKDAPEGGNGVSGAWLLADPIPGVHDGGAKRKLVTIEDIRAEYAAELDRRSDVMQGRFPVIAGNDDEMDIL